MNPLGRRIGHYPKFFLVTTKVVVVPWTRTHKRACQGCCSSLNSSCLRDASSKTAFFFVGPVFLFQWPSAAAPASLFQILVLLFIVVVKEHIIVVQVSKTLTSITTRLHECQYATKSVRDDDARPVTCLAACQQSCWLDSRAVGPARALSRSNRRP